MSDGTKIEWTDATVNAVNGCSVVSPGCTNCYAMRLAGTRLRNSPSRKGLTIATKAGPVWNGKIHVNERAMLEPLRWRRPRNIFWNAHGDLFHPAVPDAVIDRCFAVMALTPQHIHQVLTKRGDRMRAYIDTASSLRVHDQMEALDPIADTDACKPFIWPLPNVWLGVSVEDQKRADERIPDLLETPAAVRFLSCEPLLGALDLTAVCTGHYFINALTGLKYHDAPEGEHSATEACESLNWIIVGGESGPGSRPMHPDWARSLRNQCANAAVPFFFKQWGAWTVDDEPLPLLPDPALALRRGRISMYPDGTRMGRGFFPEGARNLVNLRRVSKKLAGRLLDGVEHNGMPS